MRRVITLGVMILFVGCAFTPEFVIPDEPPFAAIRGYEVPGGVCLDGANAQLLGKNVLLLKKYADELRKILEGIRKK